jgi:hypothetical protein
MHAHAKYLVARFKPALTILPTAIN